MKYFICLIGLSVCLFSCKQSGNQGDTAAPKVHKPEPVGPENSMEHNPVVGNWQMEKITDEDKDVTAEHNPENNRWIQFNANQNFTSDGDPYGRNTGKWYWMAKNLLFLDSDAGEDDDSYWTVSFAGNKMIWKGAKTDFAKRFTITHRKGEWIEDVDAVAQPEEEEKKETK